jgi:hypothetical protein
MFDEQFVQVPRVTQMARVAAVFAHATVRRSDTTVESSRRWTVTPALGQQILRIAEAEPRAVEPTA